MVALEPNTFIQHKLPFAPRIREHVAEMSRLINAALVDEKFCRRLLSDPESAINAGYNGEKFRLSNFEAQFVLNVSGVAGRFCGSLDEELGRAGGDCRIFGCDVTGRDPELLTHTFTSTFNTGLYPFQTCHADACIPDVDMSRDGPPNILIVEDEAILAMSLQDKLFDLGYGTPAAVGSGEQAVQAAHEHRLDLVLMDIKLNGRIDGVEAARQIREHYDVPVIFMTAYSDLDTMKRGLMTGPAAYVVKPVQMENLGRVIEEALSQPDVPARTH